MKVSSESNRANEAFSKEASSGDYDHVLQTVMKTVETE